MGLAGRGPRVAFYKILWLLLGEGLEGAGPRGAEGRGPACARGLVCTSAQPLPPSLCSLPWTCQNMEKVAVPSVTLIVGCGVSSLTLLMLIIIYVSVWRWCPRGAGGALVQGGRCFPGRRQQGHVSLLLL